tara:strand:- start:434 stop:625 length:192 start_codon:yes stop_codon:yes gene_type:complete
MTTNRAIRRALTSKKSYSKMIKGEGGRRESNPTSFQHEIVYTAPFSAEEIVKYGRISICRETA